MEENIENKEIIDNSKSNNLKTSNNNNQSQKLNNNDNPVKIQISNDEEKDKVDSKYNNDNDNDNELNKKDNFQISISLNIQSNFMSANSQYVKHINTLASIKTKSKNNDIKEKNNIKIYLLIGNKTTSHYYLEWQIIFFINNYII